MRLTKEREEIFIRNWPRINQEAKQRYKKDQDYEDLLQILLSSYRIALHRADLSQNYHPYCLRFAHWECLKALNKRNKVRQSEVLYEFIGEFDYSIDNTSAETITTNIEEQVELETALSKLVQLYTDLSSSDRIVIDYCVFGQTQHTPTVKTRRQQMIVKAFKEASKEILNIK